MYPCDASLSIDRSSRSGWTDLIHQTRNHTFDIVNVERRICEGETSSRQDEIEGECRWTSRR